MVGERKSRLVDLAKGCVAREEVGESAIYALVFSHDEGVCDSL